MGVSGVTFFPLVAQFVGVAAGSQDFWLSSKSMFVVPDGFWTRAQKSWRNLAPAPVSVLMPKNFRSLLFGGIDPLTMVGLASSSDVPWPNESSPDPVGLSAFVSTRETKNEATDAMPSTVSPEDSRRSSPDM